MIEPDRPTLLARHSQYGYVTINPANPDATCAMFAEPEPITPGQHEQIQARANIQRRQEYEATKGSMLAGLDQLALRADTSRERRRLQNAQRAIKSL